MTIKVVMTCHADGWAQYGRRMVETFAKYWPSDVDLMVYAEGFDLDIAAPNIIERRLPAWHDAWKARHSVEAHPDAHGRDPKRFGRMAKRKGGGYDYRRDCVRFSHKVAALTDAAMTSPGAPGWLIMCDADIIAHQPFTTGWLHSLVTEPAFYVAWLDRAAWYPECGFVIFRETHAQHARFMETYAETYRSDRVFDMSETHDSYVLQQVVGTFHNRGLIHKPFGLSSVVGRRSSHPFVHSRLAEKLDHAKGKFKRDGRTPRGYVSRSEGHWA